MIIQGLIGIKLGMTRFFEKNGVSTPITLIKIEPHYVTQIKTVETDGYCSIQLTTGKKNIRCVNKSEFGHLKKSGVNPGIGFWEFRVSNINNFSLGDTLTISVFKDINKVDISGTSKGKGFAGVVKRWNFRTQDASHGNSLSHRAPGSIGQNQTPGRVFKGKKMAGQLGNCWTTIQNLDLIKVDNDANLLLVKGSTPGMIGRYLIIKKSIKVSC